VTEGALAPDTAPHGKTEPIREIPALRKRERTWKDEVKERVRHRRMTRSGEEGNLPLFEPEEPEFEPEAPAPAELASPPPAPEDDDLPLRTRQVHSEPDETFLDRVPEVEELPSDVFEPRFEPREEGSVDLPTPGAEPRPVERPAFLSERLAAGSIDLLCLMALWAVALYFAGRISHVGLLGLRPAWPYVSGYLAFVGLYYAVYFTGTTGQTMGKIVRGLRVVNTAGQPPGYVRALFRSILGVFGIALAFLGMVPVFFDPARRAFHDRVFRTRVVKG
jgi:uncharacterized RDD family membrane protein YckC